MKPIGLITSTNKSERPIGSLVKARNIVNKYQTGKTNEPGTLQIGTNKVGASTGFISTPVEDILFSVNIELVSGVFESVSTISRVKNNIRTDVLKSITLIFKVTTPIQGVYEYNFKGDLILVWWEGVTSNANNIRSINLDCLPFEVNPTTKFIVDEANINLLELIPDTCPPQISSVTIRNSGGQLLTGNYSVFTQYESIDGSRTDPFITATTINIYEPLIDSHLSTETNPYVSGDNYTIIDFEGSDATIDTIRTGKSIRLVFTNIDTNYPKLVVGVVRTGGGVVSAFTELEIDIISSSMEYIVTGQVDSVISIEEVLGVNAKYTKAETGTILDKRLYLGNLTEDSIDPESLQEVANAVIINWNYEFPIGIESDLPDESYKDPNRQVSLQGFFPDEVYAMYIGFYTHKGVWNILHIPGRVASTTDWENTSAESDFDLLARPSTNLTGLDETALLSNIIAANPAVHLSQMELANDLGDEVKFFQVFDTSKVDGTMGYWENATETYPNCFPDFAGENVRHHKTPSLEHIKRRFGDDVFFDGATVDLDGLCTRVLRLDISNVIIPDELKSQICYWGIFYAQRDFTNSSHIALGYISNKEYNSVDPVALPLSHTAVEHAESFRFHNFSLLNTTPTITANYLKTHFKISIPETSPGVEADHSFINGALSYYRMLQDTIDNNDYEAIRKITNTQYYPENVLISGDPDSNLLGEETLKVDFDNTMINTDHGLLMASLYSYRPDLYNNYYSQELIFTGTTFLPSLEVGFVHGGDCVIAQYSFKLHNVMPTPSGLINSYVGALYTVPAYDVANLWLRQEGTEDWEKFYPKSMLHQYVVPVEAPFDEIEYLRHGNYYGYNGDYSKLQAFSFYRRFVKKGCAEDTTCSTDTISKFPYRIARSLVQADESTMIRFRTFRANDYSEMERNTGVVTNVRSYNNGLFVTTEYGTYYFDPQEVLETSDSAVALYGADLFLQKPKPVIESDGAFSGSKSKWSCIVCPNGVVFFDATTGRFYLFNGQLEELTNAIRWEFETIFKRVVSYLDNPFNGSGVTVGYDKDFHRLFITTVASDGKEVNAGHTYSYDLARQEWVCKHDCFPTVYMFSIRGLRAIYNNPSTVLFGLWAHNLNPNLRGYYYGFSYNSYIDISLSNTEQSLVIANISWLTEAFSDKDISHTNTINQIMVYNQNQSSGLIQLSRVTNLPGIGNTNLAKRGDGWIFGKFRDTVINPDNAVLLATDEPNTANLNASKVMNIRPFLSNNIIVRLVITNANFIEMTIIEVGLDIKPSIAGTRFKNI